MTTIGYPSEDFPAPPPFRMEIPDHWKATWEGDTLAAVHGPDGDPVTPNALVSARRIPGPPDLDGLMEHVKSQLEGMQPAREILEYGHCDVPGAAAAGRIRSRFTIDGQTVAQCQLLTVAPAGSHGHHVVDVVGTVASSDTVTLDRMLDTVRLLPADSKRQPPAPAETDQA